MRNVFFPGRKAGVVRAERRCPECLYDLTGLPQRHRCPECGAEYDERTLVWRVRRPWALYIGLGVLALVLLQQVGVMVFVGRRGGLPPLPGLLLGAAGVMIAAGFVLWNLRAGLYLAISPRGLSGRIVNGHLRVPWDELRTIEVGLGVFVHRVGGLAPQQLSGLFTSLDDARGFRDAVLEAKTFYTRPGAPDEA